MLSFVATSCNKKSSASNAGCTLSGTVIENDASGNPIAGAAISLTPIVSTIYTGSDGHFEYHDLTGSHYTVQAQKPGYQTNRVEVNTVPGGTIQISITLDKDSK